MGRVLLVGRLAGTEPAASSRRVRAPPARDHGRHDHADARPRRCAASPTTRTSAPGGHRRGRRRRQRRGGSVRRPVRRPRRPHGAHRCARRRRPQRAVPGGRRWSSTLTASPVRGVHPAERRSGARQECGRWARLRDRVGRPTRADPGELGTRRRRGGRGRASPTRSTSASAIRSACAPVSARP